MCGSYIDRLKFELILVRRYECQRITDFGILPVRMVFCLALIRKLPELILMKAIPIMVLRIHVGLDLKTKPVYFSSENKKNKRPFYL